MQVQQSIQLINPFGGIQFVLKQVKDAGIDKFINEPLGSRGKAKLNLTTSAATAKEISTSLTMILIVIVCLSPILMPM